MLNISKYSTEGFFDKFKDPNSGLTADKKRLYRIIEILNIKNEKQLDSIPYKFKQLFESNVSELEKEFLSYEDTDDETHVNKIDQISKSILVKLGCRKSENELKEILSRQHSISHPSFEVDELHYIEMFMHYNENIMKVMNDDFHTQGIYISHSDGDQIYSQIMDLFLYF